MISLVEIKDFYDNRQPIILPINEDLFILTGDNGSGKTTIINSVYFALNGNFEWFINKNIKTLNIKFSYNRLNLEQLTLENNIENKEVEITYQFLNNKVKLKVKEDPYFNFSFSLESEEEGIDYDNDDLPFYINNVMLSIDDLMDKHEGLNFIRKIRNSILYFPTYRRIDNDIKSLIESNINQDIRVNFNEFTKIDYQISDISKDRRVIGVGDEDIEELYKQYSEELRQFNSEGLNELLKKFIKYVIESLYENNFISSEKESEEKEILQYQLAPKHILDLADKLEIDNIDREKVYKYFETKVKNRKKLKEMVDKNKNKKKGKKDNLDQSFIFLEIFNNFGKESIFINELTRLYSLHLKEQQSILQPYHYLKEGFEIFFKDKLEIKLDPKTYKLNISRSFAKLSTGEKQLITLLSYIGLVLKDDSEFQPFILIDEPELSLHVSWQNKLISQLLKKENIKLLTATHSPYIAKLEYMKSIYQLGDIE